MLQVARTTPDRSVSARSVIDEAKDKVQVIDLADRLCGPGQMRQVGKEWVARCPLPDHPDKSPSFSANRDKNLWHCFGCGQGGDVVNLAALYWGHERMDEAAAYVLLEFGHDIPPRPPAWFRKQQRQKEIRRLVDDARVEVLARRLWKYVLEPIVADIEDSAERAQVAQELWARVVPYAARRLEARTMEAAS